jgi:hypothetical protein
MGLQSQSDNVATGRMPPAAVWGEVNNALFLIQQQLAKIQTATLVKVVNVTNSGEVAPVGFVDVVPLVNQIDGLGNATPHATIHNVPYHRIQGGQNAIIIDPTVGDIGICLFCSRDISKIKTTKTASNPGSFRMFDYGDGLYIGGVLNGIPNQYVAFSSSGITIHSESTIQLSCQTLNVTASSSVNVTTPNFTINGAFNQTGGGASTISGTLTAGGKNVGADHKHSGVMSGGGNTGDPI